MEGELECRVGGLDWWKFKLIGQVSLFWAGECWGNDSYKAALPAGLF